MKTVDLFNFTKEDFDRIWTKRKNLPKTWNGDDPKPCFDYNTDNQDENYFKQNNWNDLALKDFRTILFDMDLNETKQINKVKIQRLAPDYDESRYIIQNNHDIYVLSQYKSRGNIQSFVATEYGNQIHIYEFTQLLIDLGLEKI